MEDRSEPKVREDRVPSLLPSETAVVGGGGHQSSEGEVRGEAEI